MRIETFTLGPIQTNCYLVSDDAGNAVLIDAAAQAPRFLDAVREQGLTRMNGVPSLYLAMAEHCEQYDLRTMRAGFIGGGPITKEQFIRLEERLGMVLVPVYGMSECVGISCASWRDSREERAAGVGRF